MSQWSEKIPKENLSKTVSPTRYLFTSFCETWIQINNFRKSSKKFIIDLLTKNIALNLSGVIFFVGLGYSLKWWYKDQLFVVLLKQNLPALSESQQNIYWETDKPTLTDEYQTWTPFIDRIDLDVNHIRIKFKQPWQNHFYEQFIGVFGEPAHVNASKQLLTIPFTGKKDWWKENSSVINNCFPDELKKDAVVTKQNFANRSNKFSIYTLYTEKKPTFPKKLFKLSPRNLYFLNQEVILPPLNRKQKSPFSKELALPASAKLLSPFETPLGGYPHATSRERTIPHAVARVHFGWKAWRSEAVKQKDFSRSLISTDKFSYPLQLTKKLAGWQPFPNLLVLNSYLDEIPYKLENALQSYFPKKNSQLLFLSTSFRKFINFRDKSLICTTLNNSYLPQKEKLVIEELEREDTGVRAQRGLLYKSKNSWISDSSANYKSSETENNKAENKTNKTLDLFKETFLMPTKQSETYLKKVHIFETKKLLQNQFVSLINSFPIDLGEKSKTIVEKSKQSHTKDDVINAVNNQRNFEGTPKELRRGYVNELRRGYGNELRRDYDCVNELQRNSKETPKELQRNSEGVVSTNCGVQTEGLSELCQRVVLTGCGVQTEGLSELCRTNLRFVRVVVTSSINELQKSCVVQRKGLSELCEQNVLTNDKTVIKNNKYVPSNFFATSVTLDNKNNFFDMNGGLLDITKKVLAVKRNTQKKVILTSAFDPGVKAQHLPGLFYKSDKSKICTICNSWQSKEGASNSTNAANFTNPRFVVRSQFVPFARLVRFIPRKSVAEGYWGTEVDRLTQLFPYSIVTNAVDAKKLNPLLLLNTLGFTFNNFSPLTNPPSLSFYENKINVVDKDIHLDKNSRYMSGYVYPNIESDSLKAFLYPWLGKNKNLMPSHYHCFTEEPIALYSKNLESNYNSLTNDKYLTLTKERFVRHNSYKWKICTPHNKSSICTVDTIPLESLPNFFGVPSEFIGNVEKNGPLENSHYMDNIEIPYEKFNHYLAKFPGFSDPTQFFTTLPQIACGSENLVNKLSLLGELQQGRGNKKTFGTEKETGKLSFVREKMSRSNDSNHIVDKSEINKKFIQKNGCDSRKVAYSGIVVQRNKKTKDFQPFKDPRFVKKCKQLNFVLACTSKSSIWGTLFLGSENPLTNRQCHFFGQKQLSTLDTKSLQRDYLRELGKEILTQSNSKGYTELSKFSSIERTKILSLSKKVNSFFFKKRKYSYLLEPKDQWHLLFQEQLCSALEDCKKYPLSTVHLFQETNMEKLKLDVGRIKVSAPLVMAHFPKKLVQQQFRSIHDKFVGHQLEQGISWRPFCHLQKSFICTPLKDFQREELIYPAGAREKLISFARAKFLFPVIARVNPRVVTRENQIFAAPRFNKLKQNLNYYHPSYSTTNPIFNLNIPVATHGKEWPFTPAKSAAMELVLQEYPHTFYKSSIYTARFLNNSFAIPPASARFFNPYKSKIYRAQPHTLYRACFTNQESVSAESSFGVSLQEYPHYPLFTERFSEEINALPYLNKNSLFYSATDSFPHNKSSICTVNTTPSEFLPNPSSKKNQSSAVTNITNRKCIVGKNSERVVAQKNMKNNLFGIQNMCASLLMQEPLNFNSWAVLNQWVFLIALLFWIEQTLLNHVFPALFALEQILLSAAGLKTGENNRTHVLRISKNETPKFQNLAGIDGLLGELSELVLFLREQRNVGIAKLSFWNKWNKKNSYGVLLTGSPGTGKTFLVRALANEANVPVLILSASTLTASKLNNNKPSWSIRHAFKRAKQLAPCILFIDEIDALGKSRGKIVTDINEIVADTNLTSGFYKRILTNTKSTHNHSSFGGSQQMFSYEQFGQNFSNFNATLLNKWEYPLQSTILQESNEINQNSLCQEKLVDLLKIAGPRNLALTGGMTQSSARGTTEGTPSGKELAAAFKENTSSDINNKGTPKELLPTLEKEMTRGKFGPLTQLLVSMDGVSSFSGVLIMGATNRPELLDPALTRPGRFEKIIRIDKPSEQNRIEILQLYSQNLGVQQQIPWSYLATRTIGLTTADLAVAMNYSSLRAIIQDTVHTLETIEYGLNCITRL